MAAESDKTQTRMGLGSVRFLVGYLLAATVASIYTVYTLWAAQVHGAAVDVNVPACAAGTGPSLTSITPAWVNTGSTEDIWILGCGFTQSMVVKFNAADHSSLLVDASRIRVSLAATDVLTPRTIAMGVWNGTKEVGSGVFKVLPPSVKWEPFGSGPVLLTAEVHLLLMVLFIGAFGSCIYSLKSLADYRGDGKLYESWFTFYCIQPFEGAGIAFLLYMVIRGGFLAGAGGGVSNVNQFGICAIAGLAGAFSDTAFLKLREVFQTLFKPQDDRGGKLGPKITTKSLVDGVVGTAYQQELQATGGTAPLKWSMSPALPAELKLDADTGMITGIPSAVLPQTSFKITVTDSASASASIDLTFEIKAAALKITTTSLPDGTKDSVYNQRLEASGGTLPLRWKVDVDLPASLTLDAGTGTISGTPAAPSPKKSYQFTVTDSATPSLSASADITLEIQ